MRNIAQYKGHEVSIYLSTSGTQRGKNSNPESNLERGISRNADSNVKDDWVTLKPRGKLRDFYQD